MLKPLKLIAKISFLIFKMKVNNINTKIMEIITPQSENSELNNINIKASKIYKENILETKMKMNKIVNI